MYVGTCGGEGGARRIGTEAVGDTAESDDPRAARVARTNVAAGRSGRLWQRPLYEAVLVAVAAGVAPGTPTGPLAVHLDPLPFSGIPRADRIQEYPAGWLFEWREAGIVQGLCGPACRDSLGPADVLVSMEDPAPRGAASARMRVRVLAPRADAASSGSFEVRLDSLAGGWRPTAWAAIDER